MELQEPYKFDDKLLGRGALDSPNVLQSIRDSQIPEDVTDMPIEACKREDRRHRDCAYDERLPSAFKDRVLPKSYFAQQLRHEVRRAERSKTPLSIAICSLKSGMFDELVKIEEAAQLLQDSTRETDIIGYLGDNTFGLLLPDTDKHGAQAFLNKIVTQYSDLPFSIVADAYPSPLFDDLMADHAGYPNAFPVYLRGAGLSAGLSWSGKRLIDVVGALLLMLLFSPLMLATAIAIKATSPGPVIFKQLRLGRRAAPFVFYKFRSMYSNADDRIHREYVNKLINGHAANNGDDTNPFYKIKADPRLTRIGKWIRKASIDELPQLYNVLKGDMSLVGPRPPLPYETEKYQLWHLRRILEVRPGMTGLWQVSGRSKVSFDEMVRLDLRYALNWSLWHDLVILARTVKVVFQFSGA